MMQMLLGCLLVTTAAQGAQECSKKFCEQEADDVWGSGTYASLTYPSVTSQQGYGDENVCAQSKLAINGSGVAACYGTGTNEVNQFDAANLCGKVGARLCTATELKEDDSHGSGCNYDYHWVWSSTPCERTCGTSGGFEVYPGFSGAAPSGVSQCLGPLTGGVAVVRCCRDACASTSCNYTDCVAPNPNADVRPELYEGDSNDACGTETANSIEDRVCVCKKGADAEECSSLGTSVGYQLQGGGDSCLVVDCGGRDLKVLPIFPSGTTKLDLQNNPKLTAMNIGALGSAGEFDNLAETTWLYVQNVNISSIAPFAFSKMVSLASLEIGFTNLISIHKDAFQGLIALDTLVFSDNAVLESIESGALGEASNLKSIIFTTCERFKFVSRGFQQMRNLETFTANNCAGITNIPYRLFDGSGSLKSITFEFNGNLAEIESGAFNGAGSVEELRMIELGMMTQLNSATSDPFNGLSGLKTLVIKNSVGNGGLTAIQSSDFQALSALEHVELDIAALVSLGEGVFSGMQNLKTVAILRAAGMGSLPSTLFAGVQATVEEISLAGLGIESPHLNGLFDGLARLQFLEISCCQAVTTIAKDQFYDCTSLEKMIISNNDALTSVEPGAFTNLKSLHHLGVTDNFALARLESGTFDHAFDDEASSVVINLEGNGIRFMSPRAVNFDADGAPSQTIVVINSAAGTNLDACCAFEWMRLDTHYVTNGLKCNNAKPHEDRATGSVYDLTAEETEFGCCLSKNAGPKWGAEVEYLHNIATTSEVVVSSYEKLSVETKEYLKKFCQQSKWNAATKLDGSGNLCTIPADCPPGLMDFFHQKYVPSQEECGAGFQHLPVSRGAEVQGRNGHHLATRECPMGSRTENNGRRYLLDCEPWVHEERGYVTRYAVAEQQCVDCVVQNCLTCDENYRHCDECDHEHSLHVDPETKVHSCVLTEECPGDRYSTNAVKDKVPQCKPWGVCGAGQEETVAPTKLTDRACALIEVDITATVVGVVAPVLGSTAFMVLIAVVAYKYRQHQIKMRPVDFNTLFATMIASGYIEAEQVSSERRPREIRRRDLNLVKAIGRGSFGEVWKCDLDEMEMRGTPEYTVAAKTVLDVQKSPQAKQELLHEASVMAQVVGSPNLVSIIGVITRGDPLVLVLQFCEYGSMLDVLKKQAAEGTPVTFASKLNMALDVASGMAHLASLRFIHRDLAARNVLVTHGTKSQGEHRLATLSTLSSLASKLLCKVADFGLSRGGGDVKGGEGSSDSYYKSSTGVFPIRWTAPEAMEELRFTEASDVWAYAVVLVELLQDGTTPYHGQSNPDVMKLVRSGGRHSKPSADCTDELFKFMLQCWHQDVTRRPTFAKVVAYFKLLTEAAASAEQVRKKSIIKFTSANNEYSEFVGPADVSTVTTTAAKDGRVGEETGFGFEDDDD